MAAAYDGHSEIVSTLLEKGADFNACSFKGILVLLVSVVFGRAKIIRMLLSSDIDGVVFAIIIILIIILFFFIIITNKHERKKKTDTKAG